ncbi:Uncharacterised protein [Providencia alcalifaciens]|uniref:Uncharacterized protein n=1 Tax=Providencia alcalifaciens DSM 30120 TaxID=520999 RepID=B6XGQ3_9GAMM|nr:hypothetical protein [Providencia alcalifaciens]EEB45450.1 hypothetical protein PROVALCAL_02539 [Providencia alcalifaciens DSM 30120]SQI34670.1 Uncharacterised protein [Providencia alcalifaciens]
MSKRKLKITILIKLVPLWLLSWIPFPGGGGVLNNAIDRAYLRALNDHRNLKIDENNAVMKENGVKLKNLNKKL